MILFVVTKKKRYSFLNYQYQYPVLLLQQITNPYCPCQNVKSENRSPAVFVLCPPSTKTFNLLKTRSTGAHLSNCLYL